MVAKRTRPVEQTTANESRPKMRKRRTTAEMQAIREGLYRLAAEHQPMTVRQLFYRMVVEGLIPKTQAQYKGTVVRLAGEMRESGDLPWGWIVDETRLMRKPKSYDDLEDALAGMQELYRRDIWATADVYVEVWAESDSAAGVIYPVTSSWDVPLMASKGFASKTFCRSTAKTIERSGKPGVILYVGDHDPSGVFIDRDIEAKIRRYSPGVDLTFRRIAVTEEQIAEWNLPSSPAKKSDSRAKSFDGQAVEVEAIPPRQLNRLVEASILEYVDDDHYSRMMEVEQAERRTLQQVRQSMGAA